MSKILFLDIETSPNLAACWGMWKQNISLEMLENEWYIMSYAARWLGEETVLYNDCREDIGNDNELLWEIHKLLDEADIVVCHNVSFDIPKIRSRLVLNGFLPPSPFKTYCTLQASKKVFGFVSNKLQYLSDKFSDTPKSAHAKFPGFNLWKECLKGNVAAWDEMAEYNKVDVIALEDVYLKLRAWDNRHPNVNVESDSEEISCPSCGTHKVQRRGFQFTNTGKYRRYCCTECGKWSRSRYTENTTGKRKSLLT